MPQIRQLEAHVADLIAAGEVVERPASVVKELVENAIDAGASAVAVEIRRGGMGLIRVTDNGCGIAPGELPTAFLRHATSKLRSPEDLGRIGTLGFRGEALAAISAVSRVEILTRQRGAASGASLHLEGGVPGTVEEAGAPEGTAISVRDLFFNTPARLKFMRRDSAETAAVAGLMQHLALSHPDISFKFTKDGTESLHTPGDGKPASAVYAALGRDFAKGLVPVEGRGGEIAVSGFVTAPLQGRGSRSMQVFFVNGRFIKSQLLTAALEEGYRNQIMKGKFPGCVLSVTLPVSAVDVNVHPAKTQVKFAREREVFDAVYHTVLDSLAKQGGPVSAPSPAADTAVNPRRDFFQAMDAKTYRQQESRPAPAPEKKPRLGWNTEWKAPAKLSDSRSEMVYRTSAEKTAPPSGDVFAPPPSAASGPVSEKASAPRPVLPPPVAPRTPAVPEASRRLPVPAIPAEGGENIQQTLEPAGETPWRIAGEVLNTYIVCESAGGCIYLIDKHAAHERINFDRLMAAREPPMRQTLLQPAAAELKWEDGTLLLDNLPLLDQLGFGCEDFGGGAILVREVPADIDAADVSATLEELAECLRTGRSAEERRENLLHTMACKAAIKGGWTSDPAELRALVEKVQSGEVRYCPHGRPVAVKLTRHELEKMFKRA
ncbi:MAG: DNA mismatch repair endonuclease MutL [Oscillibacter sp.]|jgi:DNA mismatch repair protein MutL|nr:DNA mismatch repair endonuclease MutL [uncultured Oscillibacter sp.]MCI8811803.1 DNA mismatch repair endonuclease MutL [Oscillibacter sp.]